MSPRSCTMLLARTIIIAACACKAESGVDSGLPAGKRGSDLSDTEQKQLCEAGNTYLDDQFTPEEERRQYCLANQSAFTEDCQLDFERCLEGNDPVPERHACGLPLSWADCDATIAEIEACWTEVFDAVPDYVKLCPPKVETPEISDACMAIEARCPRRPA